MVSPADVQRLFLQAILSRGFTTEKLAKVLKESSVAAVKDESLHIPDMPWDTFIANVNRALDPLDLSLKFAFDEMTGKKMCILANMKSDEIAQLATEYSLGEIAYFKAVVEQIMLAPRDAFSVSSFAALREVGHIKPVITKTQGEIVLASFVSNCWLIRSRRGRYSLSLRAIQELAPYLKDNYAEQIYECHSCKEMITKGIACHRATCHVRLHIHCFKTYRTRTGTCPSCKMEWPRGPRDKPLIPIGEDAARDGDEHKRRTRQQESHTDQEMDETQEDQAPSQQKAKKKAATAMDVDDDDEAQVVAQKTSRRRSTRGQ